MNTNTVDNGVQEVSPITAFFSLQTCGEPCWHAKEEICHCYCGGKNHGCLKTANGVAPTRMAKIDGYMYRIKAIGKWSELYNQAQEINKLHPYKVKSLYTDEMRERFYSETDNGAYGRLKPATMQQCQKWSELSQFRGMDRREIYQSNGCSFPYILWERI